uniref:HTH_7 domain-containing protein n=1 Tax=Strongyloides papillosus TaxID=174720 RepID=A0A0N5C3F4_STREA
MELLCHHILIFVASMVMVSSIYYSNRRPKSERPVVVGNEDNFNKVKEIIDENSKLSIREMASITDISKSTIQRLLKNYKYKAYKSIGRKGAVLWPPRNPDLTVCDYFLWGYLKQKVYSHKINNLNELKSIISEKIKKIPIDFIGRSIDNIIKRCEKCQEYNGGIFEMFLGKDAKIHDENEDENESDYDYENKGESENKGYEIS